MRRWRTVGALALGLLCGAAVLAAVAFAGAWRLMPDVVRSQVARRLSPEQYEQWARARFEQRYPGERPLNWRIADTAEQLYRAEPMGGFVLHENDCSDFVGCIIDEALGPGARFTRNSDEHVLCGRGGALRGWLFDTMTLADRPRVQPGDVIGVRHSPHYAPHEDSISHVGVIGPDGRVIDFSKLRSWPAARYGRHDFAWFIRHNRPEQVRVGRLRPEYRYRVVEIGAATASSPP